MVWLAGHLRPDAAGGHTAMDADVVAVAARVAGAGAGMARRARARARCSRIDAAGLAAVAVAGVLPRPLAPAPVHPAAVPATGGHRGQAARRRAACVVMAAPARMGGSPAGPEVRGVVVADAQGRLCVGPRDQ